MRSERPCLILLTGYLPAAPTDWPAELRLPRHRINLQRLGGFNFSMPACSNKCASLRIGSLDLHGGDPGMSVAPTIQHVDQVYAVVDGKGAHPVTGVGAWVAPCLRFGIAKTLKKRQLHPRYGCHLVAGSKTSVAGAKGS
jgi:hypothetical protein